MKKLIVFMMITLLSFAVLTACVNENTDPNPNDISPRPEQETEIHKITLYFADNDLVAIYRIQDEINVRKGDSVAKAALEKWIKGPQHNDLSGLIHPDTILEYIEDIDGIAHVSFSRDIQRSNLGSSGELMLAEQIAMIMEQFGYSRTQILVEGEIKDTLLGSLYAGEPIIANSPDSYLWIHEKEENPFVLQNLAFRIYEPAPGTEVTDRVVIRGLARTFEATVQYELEDGHFILAEGFVTASEGAPGWGEFEIVIEFDKPTSDSGMVILFEESAKDGSRINEIKIPLKFAQWER